MMCRYELQFPKKQGNQFKMATMAAKTDFGSRQNSSFSTMHQDSLNGFGLVRFRFVNGRTDDGRCTVTKALLVFDQSSYKISEGKLIKIIN